jgi:hypothetical protein
LPGSLTRATQAALQQAAAALPVARVVLPAARDPPPEMQACLASQWSWDEVDFELHASGRDCVLVATVGGQRMELGRTGALRDALGADGSARLVLTAEGLARRASFLRL